MLINNAGIFVIVNDLPLSLTGAAVGSVHGLPSRSRELSRPSDLQLPTHRRSAPVAVARSQHVPAQPLTPGGVTRQQRSGWRDAGITVDGPRKPTASPRATSTKVTCINRCYSGRVDLGLIPRLHDEASSTSWLDQLA